MNRTYIFCVSFVCLLCAGCQFLASVTSENPFGVIDPNTAGVGVEIGEAVVAVGTLTGNPALVGVGILATAVLSILGVGYLGRKK